MSATHFDVIIIGAGISGISAAHYMQTDCPDKTYTILEGRKNIGGTWDLFRYPGIRSDSDMYTFGFAFKPWRSPQAIAPRDSIIQYLDEAVKEERIDGHIQFEHKLLKASWSTQTALWSLSVMTPGSDSPQVFTCSFLSLCMGYYDYENGYAPVFTGRENFKGTIVHPQHWDAALDYLDKKIVVIGSGATAVTLIPVLAKDAAHVTMLQRSPTYIASQPDVDKTAISINKILPKGAAYRINRIRKILAQRLVYTFSKSYPLTMKKILLKNVKASVGDGIDIDTHFSPGYNPWDQRLCLAPNGDFFKAIKAGKVSVVTDHINRFTETGIQLASGQFLEADIIVTATGLNARLFSNVEFEVDGEKVDFSKTVCYKSAMISDIPNMTFAFGYTNASWTLKCDMTNQYTCRLINYMAAHGYKKCVPVQNDPALEIKPFSDFSPGYILRVINQLPKTGGRKPWKVEQNYYYDKKMFEKSPLDDGVLQFK